MYKRNGFDWSLERNLGHRVILKPNLFNNLKFQKWHIIFFKCFIVPFSELSIMKNFKSHKLGKCVFKNSHVINIHIQQRSILYPSFFDLSPYVVLLECFKPSSSYHFISPIKVELIIEGKCNTWSLRWQGLKSGNLVEKIAPWTHRPWNQNMVHVSLQSFPKILVFALFFFLI